MKRVVVTLVALAKVLALVAQGIERWFPVPKVGGSNPLEGTHVKTRVFGDFTLEFFFSNFPR